MTLPQLKRSGYTVEDWAGWEGRWELIDGIAFDMTPAPSGQHQQASSQLHGEIYLALKEARSRPGGGECQVLAAPVDLFLPGEMSVYQPDLLIVCDPAKVTQRGVEGVPDLIVEILSPSTAMRDMNFKRKRYEAAGVPEYLIVNPGEGAALLLRLVNGQYQDAASLEWGAAVALLGGTLSVRLGPSPETRQDGGKRN